MAGECWAWQERATERSLRRCKPKQTREDKCALHSPCKRLRIGQWGSLLVGGEYQHVQESMSKAAHENVPTKIREAPARLHRRSPCSDCPVPRRTATSRAALLTEQQQSPRTKYTRMNQMREGDTVPSTSTAPMTRKEVSVYV